MLNKIKTVSALAVMLVLVGCGDLGDRTHRVDRTEADFAKICLQGVAYWFRSVYERSYLTPVWTIDPDGTPRLEACTRDSVVEHNDKFRSKADK
jgi:hypothetical protein